MGAVVKNMIVASVALAVWLLIDFVYVVSGQDDVSRWPNVLGYTLLVFTPVGFYVANLSAFRDSNDARRYLYPALLAGALAVVWFVVSFIVVANFHFMIGGRK